jgi:hypothetical protein
MVLLSPGRPALAENLFFETIDFTVGGGTQSTQREQQRVHLWDHPKLVQFFGEIIF